MKSVSLFLLPQKKLRLFVKHPKCLTAFKNILSIRKVVLSILFLLLVPWLSYSQVGIGTTNPQETLHVEGTLCVTNTSTKTPAKLAGLDGDGTMADVFVGPGLELDGNILKNTASGGGSAVYLVATINVPDGPPGEELHDYDIDLGGANANKVVFRLVGRTANYKITGIAGGTDGRHIVLFNVSTTNLTLVAESLDSAPKNRLITLANNVATSGQGTAELVYDGTLQRWILIGFRD